MSYKQIRGGIKKYTRDGRSPIPNKIATSRVMSANRGINTKPEIIFRHQLLKRGMNGYRLHWHVSGRPDIAFVSKKVAIFVNGCFWHRCPRCKNPLPKTHKAFWQHKFTANRLRDKRNTALLKQAGWKVLTMWECELEENIDRAMRAVKRALSA